MNSQLALLTAYSRAACKPTPPSALVYVRISSATLVNNRYHDVLTVCIATCKLCRHSTWLLGVQAPQK